MLHPQDFDVIVVGGGHAGTEAALAAARMGCATLLLTHNIETLGQMSCNPSIGGIGKGHLVKEIDALGGAMAAATDEAGIQFRILNGSKGPAVRATRAQADRVLYRAAIRRRLENQPNLWLFQQAVDDLMLGGRPRGRAPSRRPACASAARAVVLTAGTFLDGRIHVGPAELQRRPRRRPAGAEPVGAAEGTEAAAGPAEDRHAAAPGRALDRLRRAGGAARRRHAAADGTPQQPVPVFSFLGDARAAPAAAAVLDHAHQRAHARDHPQRLRPQPDVHRRHRRRGAALLPEHRGQGQPLRRQDRHQIFLEPEGLTTHEFYPNGISTSLPFDIQLAAVQSMRGLEQAHILRPGYAIEYDYFDPRELKPSFETRAIARPVLRRPDQRHHGLRGGRGAGPVRRRQRGAAGAGQGALAAAPRPGLPGRAGRRPGHQGRDRALPHVHQPRRVPAAAARGQRRPAPDRDRPRAGPGGRRALGRLRAQARAAGARAAAPASRPGCARPRCRRPMPSACWARRWSTNTAWPTCCAGPGVGFDAVGELARDRGACRRGFT